MPDSRHECFMIPPEKKSSVKQELFFVVAVTFPEIYIIITLKIM